MKILTFAEDNPAATLWFALIYQAVGRASPGPRPLAILRDEAQLVTRLDAISDTIGEPLPDGFQMRRLREPCTVTLNDMGILLSTRYVSTYGFQPYLSATVLALLETLATLPDEPQEHVADVSNVMDYASK